MKPREMINFLEANGYYFLRARGGSHRIYTNGTHCVPISVHGSKDFSEDIIRKILTETGISKADLLKYLKR